MGGKFDLGINDAVFRRTLKGGEWALRFDGRLIARTGSRQSGANAK